MTCLRFEECISDYLENTLENDSRDNMDLHITVCTSCSELLADTRGLITATKTFPIYEVPVWLPSRIVANTPRLARETWTDMLAGLWRWFIEPRTAIGVLATVLMVAWMASMAGVSGLADVLAVAENPVTACYNVYDSAVRTFYRAPLVTAIQAEIEQLRDIS